MRWCGLCALLLCALAAPASAEEAAAPPGPPVKQGADAKQGAIYQRPFIVGEQRAALGGYFEANVGYAGEEGVDEGPSFELQRFNLFVYSALGSRARFLSELEFEHGVEEIAIETALLDLEIAPELILRAGVLLTPLGAFNQAHDGPRWDFVERPLVSTTIIPATLSELGAGAHGSVLAGPLDMDWQLYVTQGLTDAVADNETGRVDISAGKAGARFAADNNGHLALTGRLAARYGRTAELGLSGYRGRYNTDTIDGFQVDDPRALTIAALDLGVDLGVVSVRGEGAWAWIALPESLEGLLGGQQRGFYLDVIAPIYTFEALGFDTNTLLAGARVESVDYHVGALSATGEEAGDSLTRLTGTFAWRPGAEIVVRLNYSYQWAVDLLNNPPARGAALRLGVSTYF